MYINNPVTQNFGFEMYNVIFTKLCAGLIRINGEIYIVGH